MESRKLSLFSVFFVFFLDNFGFALAFPIIAPMLLNSHYHFFSPEMSVSLKNILLGVMLASFSIGQFIGAPIIGDMADSVGRKRLFYVTITGTAVGFFLSAIAISLESYTFLLIARFLSGLVAGNLGICLAAVVDLSITEEEKGRNFGWIATIGGVSWVLSMLINGILSNPKIFSFFSPALPFWLCGGLLLVSVILIARWYQDTFEVSEKMKLDLKKGFKDIAMAFSDKETLNTFIVAFFWYMGWFMMLQWVTPYYIHSYKASQLSVTYLLIVFGVAWTIGSCVINAYLVKYVETIKLFLFSSFILFLAFFFIPFIPQTWFLYTGISIASLAGAIAWPNFNNIVSLAGNESEQGKLMGINQGMLAFGQVVAPLLGGLLVLFLYNLIFFSSAIFILISVIIMFFERKRFVRRSLKQSE
ncbi:MAG: Tetracycline resistance protein, class B [Chlamydiia bacterium]|nr:Tetracycline resistance protein, class B [Chlamydiia bacterium]